jgi:hypothetical protein
MKKTILKIAAVFVLLAAFVWLGACASQDKKAERSREKLDSQKKSNSDAQKELDRAFSAADLPQRYYVSHNSKLFALI